MMRGLRSAVVTALNIALLVGAASVCASAQDDDGGAPVAVKTDSAAVARGLSSRHPFVRREAAESLARAAAVEHRRLAEGYRAQERDSRVRLALDWALYRMGRGESLFDLVKALDEKKLAEQSVSYLKQVESPGPLYVFLGRVNGNTLIRLLEVLAAVGDADTLERVKPFTGSLDPLIADAARFAEREITIRLEETPAAEPRRQRKVGRDADAEP